MSQTVRSNPRQLGRVVRELSNRTTMQDAISGRELADQLGVHPSTVRNYIEELRDQGWCIGSKAGVGYWLLTDKDEFQAVMNAWDAERRKKQRRMQRLAENFYGGETPVVYGSEVIRGL